MAVRTRRKSDLDLALTSHRYRLPNGTTAASVTGVIGFIDDGKSMNFARAAVKIGRDFQKEWSAKADKGSRIHKHLENWLDGLDAEDVTDEETPYLDALSIWIEAHGTFEMIDQEVIVIGVGIGCVECAWCTDHADCCGDASCTCTGYGGRFDLLAIIDGETWLIDLKTGRRWPMNVTQQLNAYARARRAIYDDDGNLQALDDLPHIDRLGALYVDASGAELVEHEFSDEWYDLFTSTLDTKIRHSKLKSRLTKEGKAKTNA